MCLIAHIIALVAPFRGLLLVRILTLTLTKAALFAVTVGIIVWTIKHTSTTTPTSTRATVCMPATPKRSSAQWSRGAE